MTPLIDATEMYLRTVWELEEEGIPALRARLVERLGLSAPAVSETVARLEHEGLVHVGADRTLQLTPAGRAIATSVMRKHRLAELLLEEIIGLSWEETHNEACRWEHVISDAVEDRLVALLGNPRVCPHGNPIPGRRQGSAANGPDDGGSGARAGGPAATAGAPVRSLAEAAKTPGPVRVARISEWLQVDVDAMRQLRELDLRPGTIAEVLLTDGRVVVRVHGQQSTLPDSTAEQVYVSVGPAAGGGHAAAAP